jgi:hypothetical protein
MIFAAQLALLASQARAFDARLGWTPIQNAKGYRVYTRQVGLSHGAGLDVGLIQPDTGVVHYVATGLPAGSNYFAVAAYDASGVPGPRSNELSLVMSASPAPTSTRTSTPTIKPSSTPTRSAAPIATATPSRTLTRTPTRTPTVIGTATRTSIPPSRSATATATRTTTRTYTATATPATTRKVWFQDRSHVDGGMTVSVPVKIASGSGVRSIAISATYDPNVVVARTVQLSGSAANGTLNASLSVPGTLIASATVLKPITTKTEVFRVAFVAVGPCASATDLLITSCRLDRGAVGCRNTTGRIVVNCP